MKALVKLCCTALLRCFLAVLSSFGTRTTTNQNNRSVVPLHDDCTGTISDEDEEEGIFLTRISQGAPEPNATCHILNKMDIRPILLELEKHPKVHVSFAKIEQGASEELLQQAEAVLGIPTGSLHPVIRAFYKAQNGVCIRWSRIGGRMYEKYLNTNNRAQEPVVEAEEVPSVMEVLDLDNEELMPCDGMLFFPPIQDVFSDYTSDDNGNGSPDKFGAREAWEEILEDVDEDMDDDLYEPFDFLNKQYDTKQDLLALLRFQSVTLEETKPMMLFEPGNADPWVFRVDTNVTCIEDARHWRMTLSQYLVKALRHCGLIWRVDFWFRPPPRQIFPIPIAEEDLPIKENLERVLAYLEQQY